ncbi:hypothetical protein L1049_022405 [Liquidambar formosana]|uniref:DUF676 domain-containing protein n=1 Tax=Liquidambar formosana TaxID=63359 RepID=A0AAP0RE85_LIQFO
MIAAISPLRTANSAAPIPTPTTRRCSVKRVCFYLGFRSKFEAGGKFARSVDWSRMELLRRMVSGGCFKEPPRKGPKVEVESVSGGEDLFDAAAAEATLRPEHLVVMVNGIVGSAADWRYAAEQFVQKLPDRVIVHRSERNYSRLTFDGVDLMGERLAEEVLAVVRRRPEVRKISFVAHSLGGLVARYAIGRLYENSPERKSTGPMGNNFSEERTNSSMQCLEQPCEARIAGLEPMNFITVASPHLGSRGHRQVD